MSFLLNFNHSHSCCSLLLNGSKVTAGHGMVTHQSQLCTSVQIRTVGFSSISCSGRNGNKISYSFLGIFHLPSTLLGNRVWSPFAQGDIRPCPSLDLGNLFPHLPVSHRHLPSLPPARDWMAFYFPQQPWVHSASAFHQDNIPEVRI